MKNNQTDNKNKKTGLPPFVVPVFVEQSQAHSSSIVSNINHNNLLINSTTLVEFYIKRSFFLRTFEEESSGHSDFSSSLASDKYFL